MTANTAEGLDAVTELGDRLRELRQNAGVSQARMARLLDTWPNRISDWENGRHRPSWTCWPATPWCLKPACPSCWTVCCAPRMPATEKGHLQRLRPLLLHGRLPQRCSRVLASSSRSPRRRLARARPARVVERIGLNRALWAALMTDSAHE